MPPATSFHGVAPYVFCILLLGVGLYAVTVKKNLIKVIVGVLILDYAVNLLLVLVGYRSGGKAPILTEGVSTEQFVNSAVDPLPQAMVLTSIVISLSITALMVALLSLASFATWRQLATTIDNTVAASVATLNTR